jgi:hypothetical protein
MPPTSSQDGRLVGSSLHSGCSFRSHPSSHALQALRPSCSFEKGCLGPPPNHHSICKSRDRLTAWLVGSARAIISRQPAPLFIERQKTTEARNLTTTLICRQTGLLPVKRADQPSLALRIVYFSRPYQKHANHHRQSLLRRRFPTLRFARV